VCVCVSVLLFAKGWCVMAMIEPKSQDERRVEESQFPTGMYLVQLKEVREIGPSAKFPNGNNRLVFDFEVADGPFKGKRTAYFVGKTIFRDAKTGKESNLVKLGRSMGVSKSETGFDPDTLVGKHFNAMCEQDTATPDGRTWVRAVTPAGAPGAGQPAAKPPAPPLPPGATKSEPAEPADDSRWNVWDADTQSYLVMTGKEVRDFLLGQKMAPSAISVCPEGSQDVKTADLHGFIVAPF